MDQSSEAYDKLPRVIPYAILPVGMALLLYRFVQATARIWTGRQDSLIVSHEVEDEIDQLHHDDDDEDVANQKPGT